MLNSVNNVNFQGWGTVKKYLPRKIVGYSSHTPKAGKMRYGQYMPEFRNENPITTFFKHMIETYKEIREAMKPDAEQIKKLKNI